MPAAAETARGRGVGGGGGPSSRGGKGEEEEREGEEEREREGVKSARGSSTSAGLVDSTGPAASDPAEAVYFYVPLLPSQKKYQNGVCASLGPHR